MAKRKASAIMPGQERGAMLARHDRFAMELVRNGGNQSQAAMAAGYSDHTSRQAGYRLMKMPGMHERVAALREQMHEKVGLSVEGTLRELARVIHFDVRRLFRPDGTMKSPVELDDDTAAAILGVKVEELATGSGKDRVVTGHTHDFKIANKVEAIDKAMRHLGLYERDNSQRSDNLSLQIVLVDPPSRTPP
jgi:phage terminase small subunit